MPQFAPLFPHFFPKYNVKRQRFHKISPISPVFERVEIKNYFFVKFPYYNLKKKLVFLSFLGDLGDRLV